MTDGPPSAIQLEKNRRLPESDYVVRVRPHVCQTHDL
jgi:hypothetical protein